MSEKADTIGSEVIASNHALRRAESDSKVAKTAAMEYVCATLTETFKAVKHLAELSESTAFDERNIEGTLLRFWQNAR